MSPQGGGTVLEGTFDRGVESTDIGPAVERIVGGNAEQLGGMRG
jgi:hypothetical protein